MTNDQQKIKQYLAELTQALAGQPASLIQDALYDTESHLLDALADEKNANFAAIAAAFGSPADVARQYVMLEAQTQQFFIRQIPTTQSQWIFRTTFRRWQLSGDWLFFTVMAVKRGVLRMVCHCRHQHSCAVSCWRGYTFTCPLSQTAMLCCIV